MSSVVILLFYVSRTHVDDWYDYFNSRSWLGHVTHISYPFQKKKNWLKEKNLYKFRGEKKFLASRRT